MLQGKRLTFDEESQALYDAVAPHHTEAEFAGSARASSRRKLPGDGPLIDRYESFKQALRHPARPARSGVPGGDPRLPRSHAAVHRPAGRARRFTVEYVTGKSWSGYNWYQGNYRSLIQVNTDLPIYIDRAIDLACHEGYPGHHVYNALLEKHLVRDRGWIEFTVYPLFSPQSLIAEGTANYGIEVAFTKAERLQFERDVLFPLAGLEHGAGDRSTTRCSTSSISCRTPATKRRAATSTARSTRSAPPAGWRSYAMMPRARAEQRVKFFDQYRSYVINYNLGKDLVRAFVERRARTRHRAEAEVERVRRAAVVAAAAERAEVVIPQAWSGSWTLA